MLQHEISVVIKGRAGEDLDCYRKLPRLKYGLPVENDSDRGFIFVTFKKYQERLQAAAQFDTDDIVLTTIGQLNTPIWRRRRRREGYNSLFIDETHLFNINELSLFHYLTRLETEYPIAYSVDRSQAVGDRGWTDELFDEALTPGADARRASIRTDMESIFRCSPDIVNLAFWVTSAGATLFTNFEDPLKAASSMFTDAEERKCASPVYLTAPNDDAMVIEAFERAERMAREMEVSRCEVAIVAFSDELFGKIEAYASDRNKPIEVLKERGDITIVERARKHARFILSAPDYVGGLEFSGVVLVGVDTGRVPPSKNSGSIDSTNFLSYTSHNRLYVAITRARFRVEVLVTRERGPSALLRGAIASHILSDSAVLS
jgi:hypothetical protein